LGINLGLGLCGPGLWYCFRCRPDRFLKLGLRCALVLFVDSLELLHEVIEDVVRDGRESALAQLGLDV